MNLHQILDNLMESAEDRFYRQYTYIQTQLNDLERAENKSEIDDEDIEEFLEDQEVEEDIGIEDEDLSQFGVDVGEDMLMLF